MKTFNSSISIRRDVHVNVYNLDTMTGEKKTDFQWRVSSIKAPNYQVEDNLS